MALQPPSSADSTQEQLSPALCGWPKSGLFLLIGHCLEDEPCTATTSHLVLGGNPVISTICLCSANPGTPVSGPLTLAQILTLAHCGPLGGG